MSSSTCPKCRAALTAHATRCHRCHRCAFALPSATIPAIPASAASMAHGAGDLSSEGPMEPPSGQRRHLDASINEHHTGTSNVDNSHVDNSAVTINSTVIHHHGDHSGGGKSRRGVIFAGLGTTVAIAACAGLYFPSFLMPDSGPKTSRTVPGPVLPELGLRLNQTGYRAGEMLEISVSTPQDGYLYVLSVEANGQVLTLYPNEELKAGPFLKAGTLRLPQDLPPAADGRLLRYPMALPELPGRPVLMMESIIAVLSEVPRPDLVLKPGSAPVLLHDPGFRTRGPRPMLVETDSRKLNFTGTPHMAVHYELRR